MLIGSVEATIAVLFAIVVLGPTLAERFRIPGIVGLIAGGMIFGPFVIGWLSAGGLVDDLGAIGILYLMFLAGLSFDIKAFNDNRRMAITFGLLGFFIPFLLSVFVVDQSADIETLGALLIGAMWASNTLVAYSEVQSAGLQSTRSVGAAVSAGVVADLMSLTVLAFATATAVIEIEPLDVPFGTDIAERLAPEDVQATTPDPALALWIGLPLLVFVCLWLLPRVAAWFFVRVGRTRPQRFVFTLALMAVGATVALLGGMEGLIGAFLAGLGLNRLIPARGPLMERLDFVGTTLFIPVFLISIGLNIDPAVLIDPKTIGLGLLFTGFVLVGKTTAAMIAGRIFGLSRDEVGLMSSLSFGQAASTLAIAQVGLTLGMFEQNVVNSAVLAIVITAFITSYATRFFASASAACGRRSPTDRPAGAPRRTRRVHRTSPASSRSPAGSRAGTVGWWSRTASPATHRDPMYERPSTAPLQKRPPKGSTATACCASATRSRVRRSISSPNSTRRWSSSPGTVPSGPRTTPSATTSTVSARHPLFRRSPPTWFGRGNASSSNSVDRVLRGSARTWS